MKWWIVISDSDTDKDGYTRGSIVSWGTAPDSTTGGRPGPSRLQPDVVLQKLGRKALEVEIPDPTPEEVRTGRVDLSVRRFDATTKTIVRESTDT